MGAEPSPKIVIVDESPIRAAIFEEGLREAGFAGVVHISEMQNLLARIYALDPDVILIDLENPSRDVLEQMFQVSRAVRRPVAMFVDQSDAASIQASVDAGVSAYIVDGLKKERVKPILDLCIFRFNAYAKLQDQLERAKSALEDRKVIDRAKGILMKLKGRRMQRRRNCNRVAVKAEMEGRHDGHLDVPEPEARSDRDRRQEVRGVEQAGIQLVADIRPRRFPHQRDIEPLRSGKPLVDRDDQRHGDHERTRRQSVRPHGHGTSALAGGCRAAQERRGTLTFGMTFPFSTHNYPRRFWMAAGGVDPDEDVRLVVLPPPYMVDSLASGHVDAFCVGAPWNSIAVDQGVGHILHFVSDILVRAMEKVLAVRQNWSEKNPQVVAALIRAAARAVQFIEQPQNRAEAARMLAQPERIGVDADVIQRTLDGRIKVSPDGTTRESRYLLGREDTARPDPVQAAWLYAQTVRWGQAAISPEALKTAMAVFRPDLDRDGGGREGKPADGPDTIGAFSGPPFDADDIAGHLAAFKIGRRRS